MTDTNNNEKIEKIVAENVEKSATQATNEATHYVGPTSIKHNLVTAMHYRELPENLKFLMEKHPKLKRLFVPTSEFASAMSRVNQLGTLENQTITELKGELYV